ncbi:MAG TPA: class I SAM-dependent methyltransferase [Methylibium sp.]|uniref:class I SAM-dependent methyltransferase n=1 Tax=Methylibium sp. TaxID=2067992 RepID=UPI002DC044BC|nr:class I SAM-dependent methyltransferase [Methylibium sp.]HEU4460725.1 class I SAM-dependent methyltransferase [Methylibium sp.]
MNPALSSRPQLDFKRQPCLLCGGFEFKVLARQDRHLFGLQTVGCVGCGLLQTNPRPDERQLDDFYAHHYRRFYQGVVDPDARYVAKLHKDVRLRYTTGFLMQALRLGSETRLLDYGCGEGSLFVALREAGFEGQLYGVELNEQFARFAAEQGRATVGPRLSDFGALDAVVINHVLEHLPQPVKLLGELRAAMAPGGLIYVDVPDALEYTTVGDLHIAHIMHFTESTLASLLRRGGFEPTSIERHAPPHHPRSIRVVARVATQALGDASTTNPTSEAPAWHRMEMVAGTAWRWTVRRRLQSIAVLRQPVVRLRSLWRKVAS